MTLDSTMLDHDLALRLRVEDFCAEYAHTIDDDRLEDWPGLFTEDGTYRVATRENFDSGLPLALIYCDGRSMMEDRISALRTANIYEPHVYCHSMSALRVLGSSGGEIRTRANFMVLRTMSEGDIAIFACGRYFDRLVEEDGRLKFRARHAVLDSRQVDTLLVVPI
jgi:anthranilate 1,2-dioxygenase small subunit